MNLTLRRTITSVVALCALGLATGCGSDSKTETPTSPKPASSAKATSTPSDATAQSRAYKVAMATAVRAEDEAAFASAAEKMKQLNPSVDKVANTPAQEAAKAKYEKAQATDDYTALAEVLPNMSDKDVRAFLKVVDQRQAVGDAAEKTGNCIENPDDC